MQTVQLFGFDISSWLIIPLVYFFWVTILLIAKRILFQVIRRLARQTRNRIDDLIVGTADFPLTLLIFTSGGLVVERLLPVAEGAELTRYFLVAFKAVTILAVVLFIDKFLNQLLNLYSDRVEILRRTGGIAGVVVRIIVIGLGVLILLDSFGVSITRADRLAGGGVAGHRPGPAADPGEFLRRHSAGRRQTDPGGAFCQTGDGGRGLCSQDRLAFHLDPHAGQ